jgi:N6-L-threonylcarbamoyladenine synthase
MKILGIETSCDETAAAVVKNGTEILSNVVATSAEMHVKTGGIIPEQAARQQVVSIIPVINSALTKAGCTPKEIDTIAITYGPGLIGSLW